MIYISDKQREQNIEMFGSKGRIFVNSVESLIKEYETKWNLSDLTYFDSNAVNPIFFGYSQRYGRVALKAGVGLANEYHALKEYDGRMCRVYEGDSDKGIFLLEQIVPGIILWEVNDYRDRTKKMSLIMKDLNIDCDKTNIFPTYKSWLERIYQYIENIRDTHPRMFEYLTLAVSIYDRISRVYNRKCLLHGDLHHENVLMNERGGYTVIDPHGVIGDPVLETSRFIENEFGDNPDEINTGKILEIVDILCRTLGTPKDIMLQCLFVDTVMSNCWSIQDNCPPERYPVILKTCDFVYGLIQG